jgi:hypothetical protein
MHATITAALSTISASHQTFPYSTVSGQVQRVHVVNIRPPQTTGRRFASGQNRDGTRPDRPPLPVEPLHRPSGHHLTMGCPLLHSPHAYVSLCAAIRGYSDTSLTRNQATRPKTSLPDKWWGVLTPEGRRREWASAVVRMPFCLASSVGCHPEVRTAAGPAPGALYTSKHQSHTIVSGTVQSDDASIGPARHVFSTEKIFSFAALRLAGRSPCPNAKYIGKSLRAPGHISFSFSDRMGGYKRVSASFAELQ